MKKILRLSMKQATPYLKGFVLLMGLTLLFACKPDHDNPSPPNTNEAGDSGENTVDPPIVEPPISEKITKELSGDWKTDCLVLKNGGTLMTTWSFTQSDFSLKQTQYSDDSCKDAKDKPLERSGTYAIGNEVTSSEGYTAYEIDLKQSGGTSKSLVALKDDKLLLNLGNDEGSRPSDFSASFEYSKGGGESTNSTTSKDLEGTWDSVCRGIDQDKSLGIVIVAKGAQFTWHQFVFSDASCKEQESKDQYPGTLIFGKSITSDEGVTARELDLDYDDGADEKRIYAKDKSDIGRDILRLSGHDSGTGKRPTKLGTGLVFNKRDSEKGLEKSAPNAPDFMGNNEILEPWSTSDTSIELKQKLRRDADASQNGDEDIFQILREQQDQLPNQEGLRSGNW
jgi:hypothetical protein